MLGVVWPVCVVRDAELVDIQHLLHGVGVLAVLVVALLDGEDLELQRVPVQMQRGPVGLSDVQGDVGGAVDLPEREQRLAHELLGEPHSAVGAHDTEGGDVSVGGLAGLLWVVVHLGEDVPDELLARADIGGVQLDGVAAAVCAVEGVAAVSTLHLYVCGGGDEGELWPGQDVVHVVLHHVVLWEVVEVGILHADDVVDGRSSDSDGHGSDGEVAGAIGQWGNGADHN